MRKLLVPLVLLGAVVWAWRWVHHDASDPKLIYDRFWIDHEPRNPKEQYRGLFVNGERPFGHFAVHTMWRGQWERFHYHAVPLHDGVLDLLFEDGSERTTFTARPCQENGFDLCLDVAGTSRGVKRYYSKRQWSGLSELPIESAKLGVTE